MIPQTPPTSDPSEPEVDRDTAPEAPTPDVAPEGHDAGLAPDAALDERADGEELVVSAEQIGDDWLSRTADWLRSIKLESWISFLVVVGCAVVVVSVAGPSQLLLNHTPTGGDMGAHVWGPDWLWHHLLPKGRLSGWTPDWYDGFPAYQYYMVVPSLFIVALSVGFHNVFLAVPAMLGGLWLAASGFLRPDWRKWRRVLLGVGLVVVVLSVPIPYNISFKLVTILGLLLLPVAAWAFGKLADFPFPAPPLLALGSLFYAFNRAPTFNNTGTIVGGNYSSTMAGEFAFSIALSFGLLYLGFLIRGMRTGKHRAITAVLLTLTATCHIIPTFYVLVATVVLYLVRPTKARLKWLATVLPVGGVLASFWLVPFVLRRAWANDMGWEKLPGGLGGLKALKGVHAPTSHWFYRFSSGGADYYGERYYLFPHSMNVVIVLAAAGVVVSLINGRREGVALGICALVAIYAFVNLPDAQLWNARVLPFLYLCYYLLAAIAIGEVVHAIAVLITPGPDPWRPFGWVLAPTLSLVAFVMMLMPLGLMPGATQGTDGAYRLPVFFGVHVTMKVGDPVGGWATWNFSGLQGKTTEQPGQSSAADPAPYTPWTELNNVFTTMGRLGKDPKYGCGRAMWEYDGVREGTYGTPMALMMLPYFTHDCIGSMEGLYFESSSTTPYHFINQTELSAVPSSSQRDLPYSGMNFVQGIQHLQLLGVKYYMADSQSAVSFADQQPDLKFLAQTGSWHIYLVAKSDLVTPLSYKPNVLTNVADSQNSWLGPSMNWYVDPTQWSVPLANKGPKDWPRVADHKTPAPHRKEGDPKPQVGTLDRVGAVTKVPVAPAKVSHIRTTDDGISFDVDRVGSPVLVKVSYFPNWQASGARGPWRVTPNLMVVIPTRTHVSLHYGRTSVDYLAIVLTLLGLAGVVWLVRSPTPVMPEERSRIGEWLEKHVYKYGEQDPQDPAALDGTGSPPTGLDPSPDRDPSWPQPEDFVSDQQAPWPRSKPEPVSDDAPVPESEAGPAPDEGPA